MKTNYMASFRLEGRTSADCGEIRNQSIDWGHEPLTVYDEINELADNGQELRKAREVGIDIYDVDAYIDHFKNNKFFLNKVDDMKEADFKVWIDKSLEH